MALVAGVDSSTQSTKVVVVDSDTGKVVREARAAHPDGTEVHPDEWWRAYQEATANGLLDGVEALGVGGQQHGMVTLDEDGEVVRPALLWNDTRSAQAAEELIHELGGPDEWAEAVGSVPVASFTVTKLRWMAEHEPELTDRVSTVLLPHDWLTWKLTGELVTDRGDASGTGYFSAAADVYRPDLLAQAFGHEPEVPRVLAPSEIAGTAGDIVVSIGTGDNMAAALGLGLQVGDVAVSIGTSGTVFGVADMIHPDGSGAVAGFADATGRFLPLVCTLNAARVLTAAADMLGVDLSTLDELALAAPQGAEGLKMVPYLDGERTPNLPDATGSLLGMTRANMTPANVARAAVEGMLGGLGAGLEALREAGMQIGRVKLIGGGAKSAAVQAIAADVFGVPVTVPDAAEYVALGAARQAAWALTGELPVW